VEKARIENQAWTVAQILSQFKSKKAVKFTHKYQYKDGFPSSVCSALRGLVKRVVFRHGQPNSYERQTMDIFFRSRIFIHNAKNTQVWEKCHCTARFLVRLIINTLHEFYATKMEPLQRY
jgi:hypothetical protein